MLLHVTVSILISTVTWKWDERILMLSTADVINKYGRSRVRFVREEIVLTARFRIRSERGILSAESDIARNWSYNSFLLEYNSQQI